jgi:hypothetical protein
VSGQLHAPIALLWRKNPSNHWVGGWGHQNRSGRHRGQKSCTYTRFKLQPLGQAVQQLRQLVTSFPLQRPVPIPSQFMWDLWWTNWHWGGFPTSTSVSPDNSHSTKCSILIYHPELVQLSNYWLMYEVDSASHYSAKKKKKKNARPSSP